MYDAIHQNDLAILSDSHGEDDLFTKFVTGPLLRYYHWFRRHSRASTPSRLYDRLQLTAPKSSLPIDPENPPVGENRSGLHYYDNRHIEAVTNILGTVLSSLAPLVSIVVLSFVVNGRARLGLVCAFTTLFCFSLAIATKARRVEIFAATAA